MSQGRPATQTGPKALQQELADLKVRVEAQQIQDLRFRSANVGFNSRDESTKLLLEACEKLAVEKEVMDRANFEEHTSELPYLCRHFGTSISDGLSERLRARGRASRASASKDRGRSSPLLALCCQSEFPPNQSWWTEATKALAPVYEVLREKGKLELIEGKELLPGEIFYLSAGMRSPLDARLLVHSKDAVLDVSQQLGDGAFEARRCTVEATSPTVSASSNIVLKDSFLLKGDVFCMAVRSCSNALIPSCSSTVDDAEELNQLKVDQSLPSGLSPSQCRAAFKQLCSKARMACRSFGVITQMAMAKSLVVLLDKELHKKSSLASLAGVAKRTGRPLVLVDCDCGVDALLPSCRDLDLELIDFGPLVDTAASTALTTPRGSHMDFAGRQLSMCAPSDVERQRVQSLVADLSGKGGRGVSVSGISKAGLHHLCSLLYDDGMSPLYATGSFFYPEVFINLSGSAAAAHQINRTSSNICGPKVSVSMPSERSVMGSERGVSAPRLDGSASPSEASVMHHRSPSHMSHMSRNTSSELELYHVGSSNHVDPARELEFPGEGRRVVELVVSVGAFGVVAEKSDGIILKSDLACLGQALELVSKLVPDASAKSRR